MLVQATRTSLNNRQCLSMFNLQCLNTSHRPCSNKSNLPLTFKISQLTPCSSLSNLIGMYPQMKVWLHHMYHQWLRCLNARDSHTQVRELTNSNSNSNSKNHQQHLNLIQLVAKKRLDLWIPCLKGMGKTSLLLKQKANSSPQQVLCSRNTSQTKRTQRKLDVRLLTNWIKIGGKSKKLYLMLEVFSIRQLLQRILRNSSKQGSLVTMIRRNLSLPLAAIMPDSHRPPRKLSVWVAPPCLCKATWTPQLMQTKLS